MKLNKDGFVDINYKETDKLIDKFIKKYKPKTPMEFALLNNQIIIQINYNFAMVELKNKMRKQKCTKK